MAEEGVVAARQDDCHSCGHRRVLGMADGVDAVVNTDQPLVPDP
jgi:hypothetical protein